MVVLRNTLLNFPKRKKTNSYSLINSFGWHFGSLIFVPSFNLYNLFNVHYFSLDFLFAGYSYVSHFFGKCLDKTIILFTI